MPSKPKNPPIDFGAYDPFRLSIRNQAATWKKQEAAADIEQLQYEIAASKRGEMPTSQRRRRQPTMGPARAPTGVLTNLAAKGVRKVSQLLGSTEREAAQRAEAFEQANLDYNPMSSADQVGTQARRYLGGSADFDRDALIHGGVGTALALGGEAVGPIVGALSKTKAGQAIGGFLSKTVGGALPVADDFVEGLVTRRTLGPQKSGQALPAPQYRLAGSAGPQDAAAPLRDVRTTSGAIITPAPPKPQGVLSAEHVQQPLAGQPLGTPGSGPDSVLRDIARRYTEQKGIEYAPPSTYTPVAPDRAAAIAKAFAEMPHDPSSPAVQAAYGALSKETLEQYRALKDGGYQFAFHPKGEDPYASPWDATRDLRDNKRLSVYPTDEGYGSGGITPEQIDENPLLAQVPGEEWGGQPVRVNDVFRAVHDAFGHAKNGVGFRADGEENAWLAHRSMFSPEAIPALTTETRGQNSFLNFGPNGETNRTAKLPETVFADQKIGLLPDWAQDPLGMPPADVPPIGAWTKSRVKQLKDTYAGQEGVFVSHMSPDEFLGLTVSPAGRKALEGPASLGEFDPALYDKSGPINLDVQFGAEPSAWQKANGAVIPSMTLAHDGRHRMAALKQAGATSVPVLVRARNKSKPLAQSDGIQVFPQSGRLSAANNGDTPARLRSLIPLDEWQP